jgi:hypothetical protein
MKFGLKPEERRQNLVDLIKQGSSLKVFDFDARKFEHGVGCYLCLKKVPGKLKLVTEGLSRAVNGYYVCPECYSECSGEQVLVV